jgi:hypothetical protein
MSHFNTSICYSEGGSCNLVDADLIKRQRDTLQLLHYKANKIPADTLQFKWTKHRFCRIYYIDSLLYFKGSNLYSIYQ